MKRTSTPTATTVVASGIKGKKERPRTSTLNYLKQFARVYHYESRLNAPLGSFTVN